MDFVPPFEGQPVELEQRLSDDPANEELASTLVYDPPTGTLGCVLKIGIDESGDSTEERALVREEVWIKKAQLPSTQRFLVEADFRYDLVDHKAERADDTSGFLGRSSLLVGWEAKPYIFTLSVGGGQPGARHYGNVLAQGGEVWDGPYAPSSVSPNPVERRSFELRDVKGPLSLGVGIEHKLEGFSNDYAYTYVFTSNWKLTKVTAG